MIWVIRVIAFRVQNRIETITQLIFILGLFCTFIGHKAFLFPFATRTASEVQRVVFFVFNYDLMLLDEVEDLEVDIRENWRYDYPAPPFAKTPVHPKWKMNPRLSEIFISKDSPTYPDFVRLRACETDYREAVIKYERDLEIWETYWRGFAEKYPLEAKWYFW